MTSAAARAPRAGPSAWPGFTSAPAFRPAARTAVAARGGIREILTLGGAPGLISFAGALAAPELLPAAALGSAAAEVLEEEGAEALLEGTAEGHAPLREWVCDHLAVAAGLELAPDQVLITSGARQALDLLARVLLEPGDTVLAGNPSDPGALQAFAAQGARVVGVPMDEYGIDPAALRRRLRAGRPRPKLLYLMPNFQNPTGACLPVDRRAALMALAAAAGLPVVEDDPYGRLRYGGTPLPALGAMPGAQNWFHLGSSSQIVAPGLQIGWLAASDRSLRGLLVAAKQAADLHTSLFTQCVLWRYLRRPGALSGQLERLREAHGRRRDAMAAALARHLPDGCRWNVPEGGLFFWLRLPPRIDSAQLLRRALAEQVAFLPGGPFWLGRAERATLRLSFGHVPADRIEEGVARLGRLVARRMVT